MQLGQIVTREVITNNNEPKFTSPIEPVSQLIQDFAVDRKNLALLPPAIVGEFVNYAYTNLGIAVQKAPGGKYVIDCITPVGRAIGYGLEAVKGFGASGIRFVIGEKQFNEILSSFHNSPRGVRFLVNDIVDASVLLGVGKASVSAGGRIGGRIGAGFDGRAALLESSTALAEIRAIVNNDNRIGFVGRSGFELRNFPTQKTRNTTHKIMDVEFSAHAIDQMQNRGVMPSVVISAVKNGEIFPTKPKTKGFYDDINKIQVIVNSNNGKIITIIRGKPNALK